MEHVKHLPTRNVELQCLNHFFDISNKVSLFIYRDSLRYSIDDLMIGRSDVNIAMDHGLLR